MISFQFSVALLVTVRFVRFRFLEHSEICLTICSNFNVNSDSFLSFIFSVQFQLFKFL